MYVCKFCKTFSFITLCKFFFFSQSCFPTVMYTSQVLCMFFWHFIVAALLYWTVWGLTFLFNQSWSSVSQRKSGFDLGLLCYWAYSKVWNEEAFSPEDVNLAINCLVIQLTQNLLCRFQISLSMCHFFFYPLCTRVVLKNSYDDFIYVLEDFFSQWDPSTARVKMLKNKPPFMKGYCSIYEQKILMY